MAPTVLALCAGYGGLERAVSYVYPDSRVVGYVEWEPYSAAVLLARMEDASLEPAPIWCDDLAKLSAEPFLGVDLITAGFSCQPWSSAGRGRGTHDERWIWPEIAGLASRVGCRSLFLENVPPLIVRGGLELVLGDLAALGFDAEWTVLRASDVGAPHQRERVFILAHSDCSGLKGIGSGGLRDWVKRDADRRGSSPLVDADRSRLEGFGSTKSERFTEPARTGFPPGPDDVNEWAELLTDSPGLEPSLRREADGSADWLGTAHASVDDQLRTLGNGVVWQQAAAALRILTERMSAAA